MSYRKQYPYNETLMLSSGDENKYLIKDNETLFEYLSMLTIDTDKPLVQRLLSITSIVGLTNRAEVFIENIDFCGFDFSKKEIQRNDFVKINEKM